MFRDLVESGVVVKFKPRQIWMDVIISYLPWILILVFLWFLMFRQVNGNVNRLLILGKVGKDIYGGQTQGNL